MPNFDNVNPGMNVDNDFKEQARKEKDQLAGKMENAASADDETPEIPKPSFELIIQQMAVPALMAMGIIESPDGQRNRDLDVAKLYIDTLGILEQKTKGNLTADEKQMLDMALYEVRMQFVNASK
jgi:hypothetical protein